MCSYLPLRQAKHSEYEQERQKAESVLQHFRERVAEIQAVISSVEKKVGHKTLGRSHYLTCVDVNVYYYISTM